MKTGKKLWAVIITTAIYFALANAHASSFIVDEINFSDTYGAPLVISSDSPGVTWTHQFTFPDMPLNRILSATLSIFASDVETNEISMYFQANSIGTLAASGLGSSTTIFDLDTSWLVEPFNLATAFNFLSDEGSATLYSSTLTVEVPEPTTISLLLVALLGFMFMTKRRQSNI